VVERYDLAIVGGGMVGASLAVSLSATHCCASR
jgi:2-polyprenyl-6-methoxyphenol hydroxylase-like FAD-dependent oxidoreductase